MQNLPKDDPLLAEIVQRLVETYRPLRIYLFGSRARGTSTPTSDYDLLIVVSDDAAKENKVPTKAYKAIWGLPTAVDVLVWTRDEFDKRVDIPESLPSLIAREGLLLHVA